MNQLWAIEFYADSYGWYPLAGHAYPTRTRARKKIADLKPVFGGKYRAMKYIREAA